MHARNRRVRSRLAVLLTAAAATLTTIAVPATASPPDRSSFTVLTVECEVGESIMIFAVEGAGEPYLEVVVDTGTGLAFGLLEGADLVGTSVAGTVELVDDATGEPIGTATVDATLTPAGPAETVDGRFRDGNVQERFEQTTTPATVSGSVILEGVPDRTIDLSGCSGQILDFSSFSTRPASFVGTIDERFVECVVPVPDVAPDAFWIVSAFEVEGEPPALEVRLEGLEEPSVVGFTEDLVFDDATLTGTVELIDPLTEEPLGMTASVDAALTSLGMFVDRVQAPDVGIKRTIEEFAVEGTLTIGGDGYELTDASCVAQDAQGRVRFTSPPRRVRPIANDLPGDALVLGVPGSDSVDTTGTAEEPEAPCTAVVEGEGEVELPISHTAWYAFEGTGGPVTVDTAGSEIDTIVGVYDADLGQLACVAGVDEEPGFNPQAAVTLATDPGVTYLVQVGGFGCGGGQVIVSVE